MSSEREPFTNGLDPFTDDSVESGIEGQKSDIDVAKMGELTLNPACGYANISTYLPSCTKKRLDMVAVCERRTNIAVITESIRQFLLIDTYEPRPYIPLVFKTKGMPRTRITIHTNADLIECVIKRAESECRTIADLIHCAILKYIDESPYLETILAAESVRVEKEDSSDTKNLSSEDEPDAGVDE